MQNFLYHFQTALLAVAAGLASALTGVVGALVVSIFMFFALLIHHSLSGGGVYLSQVVPVAVTALGAFKWLAVVGATIGFLVGTQQILSERRNRTL